MSPILTNIILGVIASAVFASLAYGLNWLLAQRRRRMLAEYRSQLRALRQLHYFMLLEKEYLEELRLNPDAPGKAVMRKRAYLYHGLEPQNLYLSGVKRKIAKLDNIIGTLEGKL